MLKLVRFLLACSECGMVSHQRSENTKCQPAEQQVSCGICTESAEVSSGIEETAHVEGRHHLQVQQDV